MEGGKGRRERMKVGRKGGGDSADGRWKEERK